MCFNPRVWSCWCACRNCASLERYPSGSCRSLIAESLVQQTQEEQMLREAIAVLTPQCRRLVEMLFFESPSRPYAEVAAELGLALGSIGFTRQKCIERLRRQLEELGFY